MGLAASSVVVGVDGGNSKTDVAVVDSHGNVCGLVRGPGSSPAKLGDRQALELIDGLVRRACQQADVAVEKVAAVSTLLAGLDLPEDVPRFERLLANHYPRAATMVDNDTLAVLLAGTRGEPGVAVVCGAGINAMGVGPDGRRTGFLSLGQLSGDWGGGLGLGREVLWHAIRAEDGRGEPTLLRDRVAAHFNRPSVTDVVLALHRGDLTDAALAGLVPVLVDADRSEDRVANSLIDRLIEEITGMVRVVLSRSGLKGGPTPVVLAGGVLTEANSRVGRHVRDGLLRDHPHLRPTTLACLPVAGAVLGAMRSLDGDWVKPDVADRVTASPELAVT